MQGRGVLHSVFKWLKVTALTAPWVVMPQSPPSPHVLPWLVSLACIGLLTVLWILPTQKVSQQDSASLWAGTWLLTALLSSVIGLCQYFDVAQYVPLVGSASRGEAFANLRQRNQFASLTQIGLLALIWWTIQATACKPSVPKGRAMALAVVLFSAALLAAGNAASASRTGLLQLVLIVVLTAGWGRTSGAGLNPWVGRLLLTTVVSYLLAALFLPSLLGKALSTGILTRLQDGGPACSSRLVLWSNVLHLIAEKPWLGWGWDELRYAHFITLYDGPRFCEIMGNAHNLPLHLAVTLGLPAALLLCGGAAWWVWRAKPWQETHATRQLAWGVLAVIGLHSLLEYPLWYGPFQMAVGLSLLLLWHTRGDAAAHANAAVARCTATGLAWLALVLFVGLSYAAWDYHRISQMYRPAPQRSLAYRDGTLEKIKDSWLFRNQVRFAELSITPVTRDNAEQLNVLAHDVLHYSPEASVVEKVINSARLLGREDEAQFFELRYRAAYAKAQ